MKPLYTLILLAVIVSSAAAQEEFIVHSITFTGNKAYSSSDLRDIMLTKESPSGFTRFIYSLGHVFGDSAKHLDPLVLKADIYRLRQFYYDNGFPLASVDSTLSYNLDDGTVDINVEIKEGPPAIVDSISLRGVADSSQTFLEQLNERRILRVGQRYSASDLVGEASRIVSLLQNAGYAYAKRDSLVVSVIRADSSRVLVKASLYFNPGLKYVWGGVTVNRLDSNRISYRNRIVTREMLFKPGETYSATLDSLSEQRLYELNLFELAKVAIPEKAPPVDTIPVTITLRSRPAHEISIGPLINDENNAFNFGGGIDYLHRNFLGDARLLSLNASVLLQNFGLVTFSSRVMKDTVTVGRIDLSAELIQPYLFSNATSLTWDVSFLVDKQEPYLQLVVRNKFRISERFAQFTTGYLDWDLERAKVDSLKAIPLPPGLETPQFNSIITFAIQRDKTDNRLFPTKGFFNSMTVEEAGVLPRLISSVFKHSDFPYAQYWKVTVYGRWYFPLNANSTNIFAMKGNIGYAQEYGTYQQDLTGPIPLNHRFFAGGSGSIRGWRTRELGDIPFPQYGGNMLIETNFEDRFRIAGDFGGVLFIDAGNLWNSYKQVTLSSVAVACGFGLRYNLFFGPLRADFGFRLYDPTEPAGQQFLFQQSATKIAKTFAFHFGIEQAF